MSKIPSIAMIPSGYKASKLYSVLPTDGTGDFTTTRNTVARRVNENGLIEEVAANIPRLDYSDGGCPSLLLEGTSTNIITYSEDFSNASWSKTGASVVGGQSSPSADSPTNAFKLVEDTSTGEHRFYGYTSVVTGTKHTYSIRVKPNGRDWIKVSTNALNFVYFNISTGVVGSSSSATGIIKSLNNGWVECSITFTTTTTVEALFFNCASSDGSAIYTGDGTSGVYIYGAMIEQNSYATSYIPTNGSPQTRTADTASDSGNSTVINSTEGTLYVEISTLADDSVERYLSISDGTSENRVSLWYYSATNGLAVAVYSGSSAQFFATTVLENDTDFNKIAIKYKINDFALWINGTEISTDISGVTPIGLSELSFNRGDGSPFYGKVKSLQVYTTALSDTELNNLTTI